MSPREWIHRAIIKLSSSSGVDPTARRLNIWINSASVCRLPSQAADRGWCASPSLQNHGNMSVCMSQQRQVGCIDLFFFLYEIPIPCKSLCNSYFTSGIRLTQYQVNCGYAFSGTQTCSLPSEKRVSLWVIQFMICRSVIVTTGQTKSKYDSLQSLGSVERTCHPWGSSVHNPSFLFKFHHSKTRHRNSQRKLDNVPSLDSGRNKSPFVVDPQSSDDSIYY